MPEIRPLTRLEGNITEIALTRGYVALIDTADEHLVQDRHWSASIRPEGGVYAQSARPTRTLLHRLILTPADGKIIDHISGNTLDNRRCNLRSVTPSENARNRRPGPGKRFLGVFRRESGTFMAGATGESGAFVTIGTFKSEEAAAKAYDRYCRENDVSCARLNFPHTADYSGLDELRTRKSLYRLRNPKI